MIQNDSNLILTNKKNFASTGLTSAGARRNKKREDSRMSGDLGLLGGYYDENGDVFIDENQEEYKRVKYIKLIPKQI